MKLVARSRRPSADKMELDISSQLAKLERKNTMYSFTNQFMSNDKNAEFLKATMMGPNAMRLAEELASHLNINENMRILDLGCGCGLSTLLLAKKYGASVFAADLWISPTENYERFESIGIDDKAVPIFADATKGLPFANGYFDLLFTVDAYHYFGDTAEMLPSLIPFVKKGGHIAVAIPGLKYSGKMSPVKCSRFGIARWKEPCTLLIGGKIYGRRQRALKWWTVVKWAVADRLGKNGRPVIIPLSLRTSK